MLKSDGDFILFLSLSLSLSLSEPPVVTTATLCSNTDG
jgi:hypothetical protein